MKSRRARRPTAEWADMPSTEWPPDLGTPGQVPARVRCRCGLGGAPAQAPDQVPPVGRGYLRQVEEEEEGQQGHRRPVHKGVGPTLGRGPVVAWCGMSCSCGVARHVAVVRSCAVLCLTRWW